MKSRHGYPGPFLFVFIEVEEEHKNDSRWFNDYCKNESFLKITAQWYHSKMLSMYYISCAADMCES